MRSVGVMDDVRWTMRCEAQNGAMCMEFGGLNG